MIVPYVESNGARSISDEKMIGVFKDETGQTEYYGLINDFYIDFYYPRYLLNKIREHYKMNIHNPKTLIKALSLMKEEYFVMKQAEKAAQKTPISEST